MPFGLPAVKADVSVAAPPGAGVRYGPAGAGAGNGSWTVP